MATSHPITFSNIVKTTNAATGKLKQIHFEANEVDVSLMNSLRRIILSEIENVGFYFKVEDHLVNSDIRFIRNDSPLHNEFISHRLSMIPICLSEDVISSWDTNQYKFVIHAENNTNMLMDVTTEHFKIFDKSCKELSREFVKSVFPPDPFTKDYILITKLPEASIQTKENTGFHLEAYARKGIPKDCVCWNSVSTCAFSNTIDEKRVSAHVKAMTKGKSAAEAEKWIKEFNTLEKQRFYKMNKHNEPSSITMTVESECALNPVLLVSQASTILAKSLRHIVDALESKNDKVIFYTLMNSIPNLYCITIKGYTHTISNLLQAMLLNAYVRDEPADSTWKLDYIGY